MEFEAPHSHESSASPPQSLSSEGSSSSTEMDTSDTDASASTASDKSSYQEDNPYNGKGKTNTLKISSNTALVGPLKEESGEVRVRVKGSTEEHHVVCFISDNNLRYRFKKTFGLKERRKTAAGESAHRENEEESEPLVSRFQTTQHYC